MTQKLAPLLVGAVMAAVIGLAAGYFGATLAQPAPGGASDLGAPADALSGLRKDVQELDRRLDALSSNLAVTTETAIVAFDRGPDIDRLLQRVQALESRLGGSDSPPVSTPGPTGTEPLSVGETVPKPVAGTGPERDAIDEARRLEMIEKSREIFTSNARKFLPFELNTLANATPDGEAQRRSLVYSRSRRMAVEYDLPRSKEMELRKLLQDEMDAAVKDVAPYLKGGLQRADFSQVKSKLTNVWDNTDKGMRGILDEDQYKAYDEDAKNRRAVYGKILDEWEDDRLSRR